MREAFIEKRFTDTSLAVIRQANVILNEYAAQGFDLSLRQLYYQFVARGYLDNNQANYKRLGSIINDARLAGLVDWDFIKDRGREAQAVPHWESPAQILVAAANSFHIDKWEDQDNCVWVMVEKQALEGVLVPVCRELDVTFIANKGYSSASTMYEIGKLLGDCAHHHGRNPVVLYLGDHDPSGIDMTRDVKERLEMFARCDVEVQRLALNMDQVEQYNPPPNPAKETDARFATYVDEYGETCWELDALDPTTLANLVRSAVHDLRDDDLWAEALAKEQEMVEQLKHYSMTYKPPRRHSS